MPRLLLTSLLLLNYLLVVGAGVLVGRPPAPRYSAAHPYVHSKACQQQHYLRLDCFERCNGDQSAARQLHPVRSPHLLTLLKGLDEHCPAAAAGPVLARPLVPRAARPYPLAWAGGLPAGFASGCRRPPQRA